MKAIAILLALLIVGCEPIPSKPTAKPEPTPTPPPWMRIAKESEDEVPDSPEQVIIIITTRGGKKWVATWKETR